MQVEETRLAAFGIYSQGHQTLGFLCVYVCVQAPPQSTPLFEINEWVTITVIQEEIYIYCKHINRVNRYHSDEHNISLSEELNKLYIYIYTYIYWVSRGRLLWWRETQPSESLTASVVEWCTHLIIAGTNKPVLCPTNKTDHCDACDVITAMHTRATRNCDNSASVPVTVLAGKKTAQQFFRIFRVLKKHDKAPAQRWTKINFCVQ